jgi:hypothetical protein
LSVNEARELYTRLSQAQAKIEEALRIFKDRCILMWAPDNKDQIPRIISALQKLYTSSRMNVRIQFLIPYDPLPGCVRPEVILDLWSHMLLQHKYEDCIADVCFIREASRCVFTRGINPVHTVKNVVAITVQAQPPCNNLRGLSTKMLLLEIPNPGESIFIDVPAGCAMKIWQKLNASLLNAATGCIIEWRLQRRSRVHTAAHPRNTLIGQTSVNALAEIRGLIGRVEKEIRQEGGGETLIGRSGMFADNTTVIVEGTLAQFLTLAPLMRECVTVSPNKAIFTPKATAGDFSRALTDPEWMRTATLRYRKSGPLKGQVFARPIALACQVQAMKNNSFISRLPSNVAALRRQQVHLEILDIGAGNHDTLPAAVMGRVAAVSDVNFREIQDQEVDLEPAQWRPILRDGSWSGRILIQLASHEDTLRMYEKIHGTGICIDGVVRTIDISSPTNTLLASSCIQRTMANSTQSQAS